MESIFWLIAFVVLLGIELASMALTTIWFAGGALLAFVLALLGVPLEVQLIVFIVVSFALLLSTRPIAAKYLNQRTIKTNADSLIGKKAKVTKGFGKDEPGVVVVNGQEWSAKSANEDEVYELGELVTIKTIKGVTLQVEKVKEER